jgi:hypothetical protein
MAIEWINTTTHNIKETKTAPIYVQEMINLSDYLLLHDIARIFLVFTKLYDAF